jgi:hypothetical protein
VRRPAFEQPIDLLSHVVEWHPGNEVRLVPVVSLSPRVDARCRVDAIVTVLLGVEAVTIAPHRIHERQRVI